jgi:glycerol-3-phosphate dehydrogenase
MLVNAGGPWVQDVIRTKIRLNSTEGCGWCAAATS